MSTKKCDVFINLEFDGRLYREQLKYFGSLNDDQIAALTDLFDKYGLRVYDVVKFEKYTPKKEDFSK